VHAAGGVENILRSIAGLVYADTSRVVDIAVGVNQSTCARVGWLLDRMRSEWNVEEKDIYLLHKTLGDGPYYFYSSTPPKDGYWESDWKLYLPYPEEEMISWLSM
jgi:predicted transcriptional regulator of viral defense system